MQIKFLWRKIHIYQKVIVIFILLILPINAVSIWINIAGATYIKSEILNSIMSKVSFYSGELDSELENISLQQTSFLGNVDLQKFSLLNSIISKYEKVQMYDRIIERLTVIAESNKNIDNAGVYIKSAERTLSIKSGVSSLPNNEYDILRESYDKHQTKYIDIEQDKLYIIKSYSAQRAVDFEKEDIICYISIPIQRIRSELSGLNEYNGAETVLFDDKIGFINSPEKNRELLRESTVKDLVKKGSGTYTLEDTNTNYWVICSQMGYSGMTLISNIPENDVMWMLKRYNGLLLLLFTVSAIIILVFSLFIDSMIHKPMGKLVNAFRGLENGNLDIVINHFRDDEFGYLYKAFNSMTINMKHSIKMNYIQKIALQQSEYKQLQSQINPHFLYNCFYNISQMCKSEDVETAYELSNRLGSYYRYITRSGSDEVPFYMEYTHAADYIEIQSIRFANRINVHISDLDENCRNLQVPRIILQPVIENAYEHAFEKSLNGNIYININYINEILHIIVEDDGKNLDDETLILLQEKLSKAIEQTEKTGIVNVCRRIQLKFGEESCLYVSRSQYGGLKVEIVIKFGEMK